MIDSESVILSTTVVIVGTDVVAKVLVMDEEYDVGDIIIGTNVAVDVLVTGAEYITVAGSELQKY